MNIKPMSFAAALLAAAVAGAAVQGAPPSVKKWIWDDSLEAVNAAPKIHKVLFENDHIRLLEVTIHAGEKEPLHGHKYPSVFALDAPQPKMQNQDADGKIDTLERRTFSELPTCHAMGIQAPHSANITDTFQQHFYRLEFKKVDGDDIYNRP